MDDSKADDKRRRKGKEVDLTLEADVPEISPESKAPPYTESADEPVVVSTIRLLLWTPA